MREMAISIGTINIVFFYFLWPSAKNRCCLNCKIRLSLSWHYYTEKSICFMGALNINISININI
jgi:hypothetical protein